jgi:hypothetical protein
LRWPRESRIGRQCISSGRLDLTGCLTLAALQPAAQVGEILPPEGALGGRSWRHAAADILNTKVWLEAVRGWRNVFYLGLC